LYKHNCLQSTLECLSHDFPTLPRRLLTSLKLCFHRSY